MTRLEHLEWCKGRALEYLDAGDVNQAITSMLSDISKHKETEDRAGVLGMLGMVALQSGSPTEARRFIEGFN